MVFSFFYKQRKTLTEKFGFKDPESRNKEPKTIDFYLFVCLFIYLFTYLFIIYLLIYLFIYYSFIYLLTFLGGGVGVVFTERCISAWKETQICETKVKWIMVIKKF